jgi:putative phosphoesterase
MRIAVVSDIHGNLTALEAVLADLKIAAPDLILHGGDLADGGSHPADVVDMICDLGWPGVAGNTDEMLWRPESLQLGPPLRSTIEEMAEATREALGNDRIAWLRRLPLSQHEGPVALVHATPESLWRAPSPEASDAELESAYAALLKPIIVYGHIHRSYVRPGSSGKTIVNTGSVSLSHDGDSRAAYLLLDGLAPVIRRVEYNVEREIERLRASRLPHAAWIARMLKAARPSTP